MNKRRLFVYVVGFLAVLWSSQIILETYAEARAGSGRSGGMRGSRSTQAPARQAPAQQQREAMAPAPQPTPMAPQTGGFMRTFGMAMVGGFLGSMLFSGLAHATGMGGFGGSGFGMIELLLLAGLGFFAYRMFKNRAALAGNNGMQYQGASYQPSYNTGNTGHQAPVSAPAAQPAPAQVDYRSLTMMDHSFTPEQFLKNAQDTFFKIQGAWNKQDTNALRNLVGAELFQNWEQELNDQRAKGQQNKMENIALRESEITEVWTENGEDYITVRLLANLLDYTVDVKSGAVVSGSNSDAIQFEEYWTFSRPVGPNAWKLSAVNQA